MIRAWQQPQIGRSGITSGGQYRAVSDVPPRGTWNVVIDERREEENQGGFQTPWGTNWTVVVAFAGEGRSGLCVHVCVSEHVSGVGEISGGVVQSGAPGTFSGGAQRATGGVRLKLEMNV